MRITGLTVGDLHLLLLGELAHLGLLEGLVEHRLGLLHVHGVLHGHGGGDGHEGNENLHMEEIENIFGGKFRLVIMTIQIQLVGYWAKICQKAHAARKLCTEVGMEGETHDMGYFHMSYVNGLRRRF